MTAKKSASARVVEPDPKTIGKTATKTAASAKAAAAEAGVAACERAIQTLGGTGFTWESPVQRLYKRTLWIRAWEASGDQLRSEVAAHLLDTP